MSTAPKVAKKAGRPTGSKDPSLKERIARRLPKIYDAISRQAELGDAAAAALCIDIVRNPSNYPDTGKQPK